MSSLCDASLIEGSLLVQLFNEFGELKEEQEIHNLITQIGDQYYGERAAGIGSTAVATGMQLGTGSTAVAKTGSGASLGSVISNSLVALVSTPGSSLSGSSRRISYSVQWDAGVATNGAIRECVLVNQSVGTQTAAPSSATIARALFAAPINKTASDILNVTWNHDILGA